MTKKCPECGEFVPKAAHFCANCGYDFFNSDSSKSSKSNGSGIFSDGKIFLVLIAIVVIVGAGVFLSMGHGDNNPQADDTPKHEFDLTITDVNGYHSNYSDKDSYSLMTSAIFNKVPSDLKGINVKTTYFDANGTEIGSKTEKLSNVYHDSDYALSFGYYSTYKKPNPDHVNVEIIKEGKVVDNFTSKINTGGIEYLN